MSDLKNFKLHQNDSETGTILSQPLLISFKRDKNRQLFGQKFISNQWPTWNFQMRSLTMRCKTCPFIHNVGKMSGPRRSIKISDQFTCTSANVIYCITCTHCKKLYIGDTGRRLGDRFCEHLRDVERNDKDASKPVAIHFNLPNHSKQHMAVCGLSLHLGISESRKILEQKFIFQIGILKALFIQLIYSCFLVTIFSPIVWLHFLHINPHKTHNSFTRSDKGANARNVSL